MPVPKPKCELVALKVSAPAPAVLVLPSMKSPFANVPPASVIKALSVIWLLAPNNKVPPEFTVMALVVPRALPELVAAVRVPPLIVVAPVDVFAPVRLAVPGPVLVTVLVEPASHIFVAACARGAAQKVSANKQNRRAQRSCRETTASGPQPWILPATARVGRLVSCMPILEHALCGKALRELRSESTEAHGRFRAGVPMAPGLCGMGPHAVQ